MKSWKPFPGECIYCGCGDAEVLTDSTTDGTAYDGDKARCTRCHCPGYVLVDEEDDDGNAAPPQASSGTTSPAAAASGASVIRLMRL